MDGTWASVPESWNLFCSHGNQWEALGDGVSGEKYPSLSGLPWIMTASFISFLHKYLAYRYIFSPGTPEIT
jgi:hypothetical protein